MNLVIKLKYTKLPAFTVRVGECECDHHVKHVPISTSDLKDRFTVYVKFRLKTRVRGFYTILIHL